MRPIKPSACSAVNGSPPSVEQAWPHPWLHPHPYSGRKSAVARRHLQRGQSRGPQVSNRGDCTAQEGTRASVLRQDKEGHGEDVAGPGELSQAHPRPQATPQSNLHYGDRCLEAGLANCEGMPFALSFPSPLPAANWPSTIVTFQCLEKLA
eukprot:CAMPEP_0115668048 /NCGR_PEP_ID=MMETSP0272-20121206/50261_1 /TAXON_ID=71861 /ORGANISM="Scrippsiella trochoidea, Strain CCMP3099" /LENGTH=150 /DNA_ID=CAMNT_0003106627 /DNA_START=974 /DNA_END=1423 /DNA_ORIENTATION=-